MDLFKSQLERIQKQLSVLTPSQKMLTAAMVAIMVMTLVWWGRYAGEPEMEPLLSQPVSADELPRIEMALDGKGIKHVMVGDKLLVPADRKLEAISGLMYAHALPRNSKDGFEEILKNINPFMPTSQTDRMWNRGRETTVSQIIANFPDVADAVVTIDPKHEVRIGGGTEPSAGVTITMRPGTMAPQQLIDAAADVLQGAESALPREKVRIIVDGKPRQPRQDAKNGMFAGQQQEIIQQAELYAENKIKSQLAYIPGIMVSVTVKLNATHEDLNTKTYDVKNTIAKEKKIHTKTSETIGGSNSVGGEPGVVPNTGLSLNSTPAPAASGPTNTQEENTTDLEILPSGSESHRITPAGEITAVAAAVRIPLSYLAGIYTRENPSVKDPTEKQMRTLIDEQLPKIRRDVMMCTNIKSDTDIAVETYTDTTPMLLAASQTVSAGVSSALLTGSHIKEAILGAMALVSLFMVSMVVKKGSPAPAFATAAPVSNNAAPILNADDDFAGEVGSGSTTLDGMEMDDDSVRTQQMLEQVSNLVKENPDSAATLVKRWMNRS